MTINVTNWLTVQFTNNVMLMLQQMESQLSPTISWGTYRGKRACPINWKHPIELKEVTSRRAKIEFTDAATDRTWIFGKDFSVAVAPDEFDQLQTSIELGSQDMQNIAAAVARKKDDVVIDAVHGDRRYGEEGASTQAWVTGTHQQIIPVDEDATGNTNLTVAKFLALRQRAQENNADLDRDVLTMIISPKQERSLYKEPEFTSGEYRSTRVFDGRGKITSFLGVNIRLSNRLKASGNNRRCMAYLQSGVHGGIWADFTTSVSKRNDIEGEPTQIYAKLSIGATRTHEERVWEVLCDETA